MKAETSTAAIIHFQPSAWIAQHKKSSAKQADKGPPPQRERLDCGRMTCQFRLVVVLSYRYASVESIRTDFKRGPQRSQSSRPSKAQTFSLCPCLERILSCLPILLHALLSLGQ